MTLPVRAPSGGTTYSGCLTVGADARGLFLVPFVLFRFGHPPLLIPWDEISCEEKDEWARTVHEYRLRSVPGVPLRIGWPLHERVQAAPGAIHSR